MVLHRQHLLQHIDCWPDACRGHASEKPELPTALKKHNIVFLGPGAKAMAALGDKVGSTILAQAAGVPTIPWSGSNVSLSYEACSGTIPPEIYKQVTLCFRLLEFAESVTECHGTCHTYHGQALAAHHEAVMTLHVFGESILI